SPIMKRVRMKTYTQKALQLMEECQTLAEDPGFKDKAEKLLNIFQSDLFQALLDIQTERQTLDFIYTVCI
uniref:Discs, large homolog 4b (Drosophila) n=1 Tax=Erpetoichthys calabaricus TaxID=27687 RepID=A0A8C4S6U1_ERPCA